MTDAPAVTLPLLARVSLADVAPRNRLLADYLAGEPNARSLFPHTPDDLPSLLQRPPIDRAALSTALVAYQQTLGADAAAVANARLLADPATLVVTVGQQPGLLTGPLYTPFKAFTAINLARQLTETTGRPAVPVFWVATDDDDREEIDHCTVTDRQGQRRTLHYPVDAGAPGQLVGDLPAGRAADTLVHLLEPMLAGMPEADAVLTLVAETATAAADFGEWFARLLARLLSPMGLVLCDPRLPALRRLSAAVIGCELAQPLQTTAALATHAEEVRRRGYTPALTKPAHVANVFLCDGTRHRLTFDGTHYRAGEEAYTPEALQARLQDDPTRFVPNAVLRPVVQEALFGSTIFVAGPNELCYWAELGPVFQALDVPMPIVLPRAGATLVPATAARRLHAWDVAPLELLQAYDAVRQRLLAASAPDVADTFTQGQEALARLAATLEQTVTRIDPTLAATTRAAHQRMCNELEKLEAKTLKAVERQATEQTARLLHLRDTLFPGQGLQERTLSLLPYLAQHGLELLDSLRIALDRQEGQHLFVELG